MESDILNYIIMHINYSLKWPYAQSLETTSLCELIWQLRMYFPALDHKTQNALMLYNHPAVKIAKKS